MQLKILQEIINQMNNYSKINTDFLKSFTNNNPEKIKKYVRLFLNTAPEAILLMKQYHTSSEWAQLKTTAHSLKPQLAYMGIDCLKETILRIEEYAGEGKNPEMISEMITHVEKNCSIAFIELEDFVNSLP